MLIKARQGDVQLYTSRPLIDELYVTLCREKFITRLGSLGQNAELLVEYYRGLASEVRPASLPPTVLADPDDDAVLECAVGAQASIVVTGDEHLLALRLYQGIAILDAAALRTLPPHPSTP